MYGILVACIAIMALFLGLFAISVPPSPQDELALSVEHTAHVHPVADKAPAGER